MALNFNIGTIFDDNKQRIDRIDPRSKGYAENLSALLFLSIIKYSAIMNEIWKPVKGYEGIYEISNYGRLKKIYKNVNPKIRKVFINHKGYSITLIFKDNLKTSALIHRLVAKAFIPNPENKPQINHKDGDKQNNHVSNLEWCTGSENMKHAHKIGLISHIGELSPAAKLTNKIVIEIRNKWSEGVPAKQLKEDYNISLSHVYQIVTRSRWSHI